MKKLVKLGIAVAVVGAIAYSIPPVRQRYKLPEPLSRKILKSEKGNCGRR